MRRTSRVASAVAVAILTTAVIVGSLPWDGSTAKPRDPDEQGSSVPGATDPTGLPSTSRTVVDAPEAHPSLEEMIARMLYEPGAGPDPVLEAAGSGQRDDVTEALLDELITDSESSSTGGPRLLGASAAATVLLAHQAPDARLSEVAYRYKSSRVGGERHDFLRSLLVGWPCFDFESCAESLVAELERSNSPQDLYDAAERAITQGDIGVQAVFRLLSRYVSSVHSDATRFGALLQCALSNIDPAHSVVSAVIESCDSSHAQLANLRESESAEFYIPSADFVGAAISRLLRNGAFVSRPTLSPSVRSSLLEAMTQFGSSNTVSGKLFLVTGLSDLDDPRAVAALTRYVTHDRSTIVRLSALAQLGTTLSVSTLSEIVAYAAALDSSVIGDARFEIGYLAAVDNRRSRAVHEHAAAGEVFAVVLRRPSSAAAAQQRFVLQALQRTPMAGVTDALRTFILRNEGTTLADMAAEVLARQGGG